MNNIDPIPDTRHQQMRALADDLRTLAADVQEQRPSHALTRVQHYCKWIFAALDDADREVADAL